MKKSIFLLSKGTIGTLFILIFIYMTSNINVYAEAASKESLIILLDSDVKETEEKIENKFSNVKVHQIKEINSLVVKGIDKEQLPDMKQYVSEDLKIPSNNIVNDVELRIKSSKPISEEKQHSFQFLKEEEKGPYDKWMWDIKQVTNNYKSQSINKGSHDVKVGIIDSGIDFNHPDLKENIISEGKSFVPNDASTSDNIGHGTMVAGTIAANGKIQGVGPSIGIIPYKVFNQTGGDSSWTIEAIIQATKDGVDVINLSLGTFKSIKNKGDSNLIRAYERAFKYAKENNVVLVASSGNEGLDISNPKELAEKLGKPDDLLIHLPGGDKNVITVAATDKENKLASYSNFGSVISISAPGGDYGPDFKQNKIYDFNSLVLATYPTYFPQTKLSKSIGIEPGYEFMLGTSLAAPKVTAAIAVMKDEYFKKFGREMSNEEVESTLYRNADKTSYYDENVSGKGIVNLYNALVDIKSR
ncbi:S8 family serine peptidase [Bacillus paramobilis]|uniref:S8 family serine peptidase n=1 Tax=Bacillus paramobilis TaxID=2817477 RepID=A0ABZ2VL68_9BACI